MIAPRYLTRDAIRLSDAALTTVTSVDGGSLSQAFAAVQEIRHLADRIEATLREIEHVETELEREQRSPAADPERLRAS